jgi:hypothetical protein
MFSSGELLTVGSAWGAALEVDEQDDGALWRLELFV